MSRRAKAISIICILAIVLGLLGCSIVPQAVKDLLATSTSTSTDVPAATVTSTVTPTHASSATPTVELPPLEISTCLFDEDCPDAAGLSTFLPDGIEPDVTNEITIPYDQTLKLTYGWVTRDQEHLDDNLEHIVWVFTIDDVDFFTEDLLVNSEVEDEDVEGAMDPGTWLAVTLSGWDIGVPHYIRYGFYLDEAIDDGWSITEADYSAIHTIYVMPAKIPTVTPGPTQTNTALPKPVVTSAPAKPTPTTGAPLVLDITIKVINMCPEAHVVVMNGPMRLKYNVGPGQTVEYQAAQGTYTWIIDNSFYGGPQDLFTSVWTLGLCE